jgi:hypothetical protein
VLFKYPDESKLPPDLSNPSLGVVNERKVLQNEKNVQKLAGKVLLTRFAKRLIDSSS